jgi:hypothetical protein
LKSYSVVDVTGIGDSCGALFRRAFLPAQIERAVDQTDVAIGLRKIAKHAAGQWIDLFSEQTYVIAAGEQTVEQLPRFRIAVLQYVIIHEPKAARKESSFAWGQAIAGIFGFVPQNEFTVDQQSLLDCPKRSADPRVLGKKKADERDEQQTRVHLLRSVRLHKAVEVAVETAPTDLGMNLVGDLTPPPT